MRRLSVAFLTILLAIGLCVPSVARAEVAWQSDGDRKTAVVSGYPYSETGRCSALMEYLGFDWSTIGTDARNKLLTNSGGDNSFTQSLAQVKNVQYETNGTLEWPIINVWATIFGLSEMWDISLTYTQYDNTVEYVRGIITGGGGSGDTPSDGEISEMPEYIECTVLKRGASDLQFDAAALTYRYHLNQEQRARFTPYLNEGYKYLTAWVGQWFYGDGSNVDVTGSFNVYLSETPAVYENGTISVPNRSVRLNNDYQTSSVRDGNVITFSTNSLNVQTYPATYTASFGATEGVGYWLYANFGTVTTPTPPQPDPPVTPPVTPTPPVYTPTPIGDPTITQPDYSEIIDWLEQLHRDLQAIEGQIVDTFNTLDADLANWFTRLSDYIGDMIEWLADELEQYWDGLESNIVMWLKRIYSRMGGNGATKPDPTTDPKGFWEWLLEQFASFFAGNVDDAVDTLADKLEELVQFFPFSIPWDIMALFALFAASPVTPVFDIQLPVPAIINASQHIAISIDLTPYNSTMQVVRAIEKVIFAGWLASMVPTWLNQIKVSDKL